MATENLSDSLILTNDIKENKPVNSDNNTNSESVNTTEEEQPVRIRVQTPDVAQVKQQVKKFTTAQGANFHVGVQKAKRVGLTALHKVATWLTPKNKQ